MFDAAVGAARHARRGSQHALHGHQGREGQVHPRRTQQVCRLRYEEHRRQQQPVRHGFPPAVRQGLLERQWRAVRPELLPKMEQRNSNRFHHELRSFPADAKPHPGAYAVPDASPDAAPDAHSDTANAKADASPHTSTNAVQLRERSRRLHELLPWARVHLHVAKLGGRLKRPAFHQHVPGLLPRLLQLHVQGNVGAGAFAAHGQL